MKYIYFEIYSIDGNSTHGQETGGSTMQNENILLIKPHTNSSGNWGFRNESIVNKSGYSVDQNWIDLTKYRFGINYKLDKLITECTDKLNKQLREIKLERILNS